MTANLEENNNNLEFVSMNVRGLLSARDRHLVGSLLEGFGLTVEELNEGVADTQPVQVPGAELDTRSHFRIQDVTSPNDYLVREHFEDFARLNPTLSIRRGVMARVFHALIDANGAGQVFAHTNRRQDDGKKWIQGRELSPLEGVIVVRRADCGLPAYNRIDRQLDKVSAIYARYAILAGSILPAIIEAGPNQIGYPESKTGQGIVAFAKYLDPRLFNSTFAKERMNNLRTVFG